LLALVAGFISAASTIFIRQGLREGDAYAALWVSVGVGTVGLWGATAFTGGLGPTSARGVLFFGLAGLIGTVGGRLLRFVAIDKVGPSIAAALGNVQPLIAAGLAILLLGERVTLPILGGTMVIVFGTALLSASGRRLGFRLRHIAIPLLSAACFGVVAVLRKVGLGHTGVVMGSAINVTTALVAVTAFMLASRRYERMTCSSSAFAWFAAAGLAENGGVFLNIVALSHGAVSVVTPLYATAPIFVLFLSFVFLRGVEIVTWRTVAGTLLTVLGVYLITALR